MERNISRINRLFTITIVGLCVASMASLLLVLYITSGISFSDTTSPQELKNLTNGYPAVTTYLEQQKQSEAHFITLANLIKDDQQQLLARTALLAALPLLFASALLGYFLARYLLRPVAEAYASQERFLQDAAHELRNPLATMSAVIQQSKQQKSNKDTSKHLKILERQTDHLVHLNEDLLFLENNKQRTPEPIDLYELLRDVCETMQPLASAKSIKVTVQGSSMSYAIHPEDFVSLTRNLLENAIKYSDEKSVVTTTLKQTSRAIVLTVRDKGIGIPSQDIPHIGKRFYRGTNVARREGTGLGFAIVQKVANDYRATVHIDSKQDEGTTVTVSFKN